MPGVFAAPTHYAGRTQYRAPAAASAPQIDGVADDFSGRFKVAWAGTRIFVLVEINDDVLFDGHRNPLQQYWDDDCLEIFIDEDFSGGDHQYSHNAFAYHVSLDNRAIDIGTDRQPRDYSDHVESRWRQYDDRVVWEIAIDIYTDEYSDDSKHNQPVDLSPGKVLGLMLAYCDNDGSALRENFIGSESVPSGPKDRGWIDAGLFGSLVLGE